MTVSRIRKTVALFVVSVVVLGAVTAVSADTYYQKGSNPGGSWFKWGYKSINYNLNSTGWKSVASGIFGVNYYQDWNGSTGTPVAFLSVCLDLTTTIKQAPGYVEEMMSVAGSSSRNKLAYLADTFLTAPVANLPGGSSSVFDALSAGAGGSTAVRSAAFQNAAWQIWYGSAYQYSASSDIVNATNWFINQAAGQDNYQSDTAIRIKLLTSSAQTQLLSLPQPPPPPAPVPEPMSMALAGIGLSAVAGIRKRLASK